MTAQREGDLALDGAVEPTPPWRLSLERALALALRAGRALENAPSPGADLEPAARALDAGLAAIYGAIDARGDRVDLTRTAEIELDAAASVLTMVSMVDEAFPAAIEWLSEAQDALTIAEEHFVLVPFEAPREPTDLCASKDVPALHRLEREAVAPLLRIAPPLPPPPDELPPIPTPTSVEERDAAMVEVRRRTAHRREQRAAREALRKAQAVVPVEEVAPPAGFARGVFKAKSEDSVLMARTRECFEEIAMIGVQRAPLQGDPFRVAKFLEDRMLTSIDAIAALGGRALAKIEPLVLDAPARDASRAFSAAMILGCFDGRDTLGAVERLLFQVGMGDPTILSAMGGALKLVPHPELPIVLRALLAEPDPACRALAIEVLAYRAFASPAELSAAVEDPSPAVVAVALPALARLQASRSPALDAAIERACEAEEPSLREAAWAAMIVSNHPHVSELLTRELAGPLASRAAVPLAIAGDNNDAERLLERMQAAPTPTLVNAVGWAGSPGAIAPLIGLLEHDDPVVQLSAAYALDRITGARLYDDVEVPPEVIDVPEVPEPDVGEPKKKPLAHAVSDPRDRPSEGANDTLRQPTIRVDRWFAYWNEKGPDYRLALKYRRGNPYMPTTTLWELDAWPLTPGERRWLQRELIVRTGHCVHFDPHDFVSVQEASLRAWAPIAQRMSGSAGSWQRPMRR